MFKFPGYGREITIFGIGDILAVLNIFTCDTIIVHDRYLWHGAIEFFVLIKK
jgi:hypothetical protein